MAPPPAVLTTVAEPTFAPEVIVVVVVPETVEAAAVATVAGTGVGPGSPAVAEAAVDETGMYGFGVTTAAADPTVLVPMAVVVTGVKVVVVDSIDVAAGDGEAPADDEERYVSALGVAALDAPAAPAATTEFDAPEPSEVLETPVLEMLPPPAAAAAAALDVPALASESAWFVEPEVLLYFTVSAPEGEVAPWSTEVLALTSVSAIEGAVCTSPRTSSEVSRFAEYAMPPGARELFS